MVLEEREEWKSGAVQSTSSRWLQRVATRPIEVRFMRSVVVNQTVFIRIGSMEIGEGLTLGMDGNLMV